MGLGLFGFVSASGCMRLFEHTSEISFCSQPSVFKPSSFLNTVDGWILSYGSWSLIQAVLHNRPHRSVEISNYRSVFQLLMGLILISSEISRYCFWDQFRPPESLVRILKQTLTQSWCTDIVKPNRWLSYHSQWCKYSSGKTLPTCIGFW